MTASILQDHRLIWEEKPILRTIYHDYYQRILTHLNHGPTLEIGGGTGNLKHYVPEVTSTDIAITPWLDTSCDAQALPFQTASFDNIVGMDVLHHIERPIRFLREAERVLKPNGRLVLLEPAITKMSWPFYHFLHPEPVDLAVDPLLDAPLSPDRQPFDANQAIPELIFGKYLKTFEGSFPKFTLVNKEYLSLWAYPLSGGFKKWSLFPNSLVKYLLAFEKHLEKFISRHIGFRLLLVIEKKENR